MTEGGLIHYVLLSKYREPGNPSWLNEPTEEKYNYDLST